MAPPPLVLDVDGLPRQIRLLDDPATVIIDTADQPPPLRVIIRMVVLRRRLRACGGNLVLVAGPATVEVISRAGLQCSIPCYDSVVTATRALETQRVRSASSR